MTPIPLSHLPTTDAEDSPHAVRTPSTSRACATRPTRHRHPSGSRKAQARRLRSDRRHRSAAKANRASAAVAPASAQRVHVAAAVPVPDRRGDHVALAFRHENKKSTTSQRGLPGPRRPLPVWLVTKGHRGHARHMRESRAQWSDTGTLHRVSDLTLQIAVILRCVIAAAPRSGARHRP